MLFAQDEGWQPLLVLLTNRVRQKSFGLVDGREEALVPNRALVEKVNFFLEI